MPTSHHPSDPSSRGGHRLAPFRSGTIRPGRVARQMPPRISMEEFLQARSSRVLPFALIMINGLLVVAGSLLGWIQPLWFSSLVLVLSNITIGIGAFQIMKAFHFGRGQRDALRDEAIRRAIESTN